MKEQPISKSRTLRKRRARPLFKAQRGRKYDTIHFEVVGHELQARRELICRVVEGGEKISRVSSELGINLSTSKFILRNFKLYGRIFQKKCEMGPPKTLALSSESTPCLKQEREPPSPEVRIEIQYVPCPFYVYVPVYVTQNAVDSQNCSERAPLLQS